MKLNAEDICLEENGMMCLCPDEEEKIMMWLLKLKQTLLNIVYLF